MKLILHGKTTYMSHLTRYFLGKYLTTSMGFVLLLAFLGWMVQLLRTIDVVTAKGQSVVTLFSQSLLVVPEITSIILYLCLALGVARGLRSMQVNKELFPIHSGIGLKPLWQSIWLFLLIGIVFDATLAHQLVPKTNQIAARQADEINADLIANSSRPGQFTNIAPDLTLMIKSRAEDGTGLGFFLHDSRDPKKNQTTFAAQSQLSRANDTLYIKLTDGAIQYLNTQTLTMSTLEFGTYSVAVRELASSNLFAAVEPTSIEVLAMANANIANQRHFALLHDRFASALYLFCLVVFAFTVTMQPRPLRSKRWINGDVVILGLGIAVKVMGSSAKQLAGVDPSLVIYIYLIPMIPLLPALFIAWRNGIFTPIPKLLRKRANV